MITNTQSLITNYNDQLQRGDIRLIKKQMPHPRTSAKDNDDYYEELVFERLTLTEFVFAGDTDYTTFDRSSQQVGRS
jgi:hypothetical protein